ncbi:MAG: hypothetical protein LBG70_01545, partial [Bifidobacteriaceae bacterium]|nr:hypothetical protein [Bifidobacteriaceae bacterium]
DAETRAASSAKDRENLGWRAWTRRLQRYFDVIDFLFHPDLIVVGGGVSREHDRFLPQLKLRPPIIPAQLRNTAGIIGAAGLAAGFVGETTDQPAHFGSTAPLGEAPPNGQPLQAV